MGVIALSLAVIISLCIVYQDFKSRSVHSFLYLTLFIASFFFNDNILDSFCNLAANLLYIIGLFSAVYLYFRFIKGDTSSFINHKIGLGDLVYLVAISPYFHIIYFIIFINIAFVFSLLTHKLLAINSNSENIASLPLAGYMSLVFVAVLVIATCFEFQLYNMNEFLFYALDFI